MKLSMKKQNQKYNDTSFISFFMSVFNNSKFIYSIYSATVLRQKISTLSIQHLITLFQGGIPLKYQYANIWTT